MGKDWTGNGKSIFTTLGASNHTEKEREINDYYATDPLNFRRGSRCPKIAFWQSKFPKNGSLSINYCDIFEKIV